MKMNEAVLVKMTMSNMDEKKLFDAFIAGFKASSEGCNYGYPYFPTQGKLWEEKMAADLRGQFEEFLEQQRAEEQEGLAEA